jgi:hypothetical protein
MPERVVKMIHTSANCLWNQTILTAAIDALNHQTTKYARNVGAWHGLLTVDVGSAMAVRRKHVLEAE